MLLIMCFAALMERNSALVVMDKEYLLAPLVEHIVVGHFQIACTVMTENVTYAMVWAGLNTQDVTVLQCTIKKNSVTVHLVVL